MELKWKKAKAGRKFSGDTIIIPVGTDDKDARLVRCAINDCIYIPVDELKKLPIDDEG